MCTTVVDSSAPCPYVGLGTINQSPTQGCTFEVVTPTIANVLWLCGSGEAHHDSIAVVVVGGSALSHLAAVLAHIHIILGQRHETAKGGIGRIAVVSIVDGKHLVGPVRGSTMSHADELEKTSLANCSGYLIPTYHCLTARDIAHNEASGSGTSGGYATCDSGYPACGHIATIRFPNYCHGA